MNIKCNEISNYWIIENYWQEFNFTFSNSLNLIKDFNKATKEYYSKLNKIYNKNIKNLSDNSKFTNDIIKDIPKIIFFQLENIKTMYEGLEKTILNYEDFINKKRDLINKLSKEFKIIEKELENQYNISNKTQKNYYNLANESEDLIIKNILTNKIIDKKYNNTENKNDINDPIFQQENIEKEKIKNNLEKTKKIENEYIINVNKAKLFEEKFLKTSNNYIQKSIEMFKESCDKLKQITIDFLILNKNAYKVPSIEIDNFLPILFSVKKGEEFEKKLKNDFTYNFPFNNIHTEPYKIKIISNNGNSFSNDLYKKDNEIKVKDVNKVVKKLFEYLILKDKDYIMEIEEEKLQTNELTNKIFAFSNKNISLPEIKDEELEILKNLMSKIENRKVFITKLNEFRSIGIFSIPEKTYNEISIIMKAILDFILKDEDFFCAKNIIILSQTFYILNEKKEKIYLQKNIENHSVFKNLDFWQNFIQITITNTINESIEYDTKNGIILKESEKDSNKKYNTIIFSQLVTLADNMIEFGNDISNIKTLIKQKINFYKIDEDSENMIWNILDSKKINK